jgi:UDP-N-acetylglucosamine--N-acetylmuramyl-(pentapeptide) pyrophosphoryl-undecaprenol N-acetylglucosamine transferase
MRAAFAGGGSAGHLFPALAIAQRFLRQAPEAEALFFGARKPLDEKLLAPYHHRLLSATGLPYGLSLKTVTGIAKMAMAGMEAMREMRGWRPQVIVGTGGYISAAAVPAATMQGIPSVIHVSDAMPDRSGLKLASSAARITVAFEAAAQYFPADKVVVTGQPVREEVLQGDRESARAELGYGPDDIVLLITGGSQGARTLNEATLGALPKLLGAGLKIYHQTGSLDYEKVRATTAERQLGPSYVCREFIPNMGTLLAAADMFLMRAGSSSLAEAAAWGLPMIVVPGAFAHGHQQVNAQQLEQRGAAVVVQNADLTAERLTEVALDLLSHSEQRQAMSQAALGWGSREAADRIAALVVGVAGG